MALLGFSAILNLAGLERLPRLFLILSCTASLIAFVFLLFLLAFDRRYFSKFTKENFQKQPIHIKNCLYSLLLSFGFALLISLLSPIFEVLL